MGRRKVAIPEKKTTWTISIDPKLKTAAKKVAESHASSSDYVCGLIKTDLKRLRVKF